MQETIITLFLKSRLMLNMSNQLDSISLPPNLFLNFKKKKKKVISLLMFESTAGFCSCYFFFYYFFLKTLVFVHNKTTV